MDVTASAHAAALWAGLHIVLLLVLSVIDQPGRISKNAFDKQVRDVVRRTGADPNDL